MSATYFSVVFLRCCLCVLTVVVSRRPAAGIRLVVVQFILLIGPWLRRGQRAGLRLLGATLDLHLPLQCLEKQERARQRKIGERDELNRWTASTDSSLPNTNRSVCISSTAPRWWVHQIIEGCSESWKHLWYESSSVPSSAIPYKRLHQVFMSYIKALHQIIQNNTFLYS